MPDKTQLHVSMLRMICPVAFQRRYGARFDIWPQEEIIPPGVAAAIGSSVDMVVNKNMKNKLSSGALLSAKEIADLTRDEIMEHWKNDLIRLTPDEKANKTQTKGRITDISIGLSLKHNASYAPVIEPVAIQKEFVIIMDGFPIDLAGTMDIQEKDAIRDTKTSGKTPSKTAEQSLQMAMYSLAFKLDPNNEMHKYPARVFLDYVTYTKTKKGHNFHAHPRVGVPSESWINPLRRRIERFCTMIDAVKAGYECMSPANPEDWVCTAKWCGYAKGYGKYKPCPFWSRREK